MKRLLSILLIATGILLAGQVELNAQSSKASKEQGEKLLNMFWKDVETQNVKSIESYMAEGFQSVHQDGARNRDQELKLIKNLKPGKFTLRNIKVTQSGPALIVTYFVSVEETIAGKRLSKKPAARLTTFVKSDDGWKLVAHANLKPMD